MRSLSVLCLLALATAHCFAWSGHSVTQGDLSVLIEEVAEVTELDTPVSVQVVLANTGNGTLAGQVQIKDLVDCTRIVGPDTRDFELEPGGKTTLSFEVAFGEGSYSALYPVHAYVDFNDQDENEYQAHAVRIVTTRFAAQDFTSHEPTPMEVNVVPERGGLLLWTLRTHRVVWNYYDKPFEYKQAGWMGSDPESRASMSITSMTRGDTRAAINMHPTWGGGGGTVAADYLLKLPATKPIKLSFANAIRDHTETEPASDGVLFRVWAGENQAGDDLKLLYENFTDAKVWEPGEADLSQFAGKTILLRLESHPGPDRDTTCDSSYWAEPIVTAGQRPPVAEVTFEDAVADTVEVGRRILAGSLKADNRFTFVIGEGKGRFAAVLKPTARGIVDGVLTFVGAEASVSFDGFNIDILGHDAVRWPTSVESLGYATRVENGKAIHTHRLRKDGQPADLVMAVWVEGDGLRIAWECPQRVSEFSIGPSDQTAGAVYYGHGYRIENPKPFRAGFGGHNLATSHVGCDFEKGVSVLQAVDVPPDYFEVSPQAKLYALHTHMNGTLTLVPSEKGAFDCAIKYRPLYDKQPAGGVERKAGRFCFDIWGGRYADIADRMTEAIKYGLTDSLLIVHDWQRWGYDYRLPDIWPPNPSYGTIDDMSKIGQVCNPEDIPWGLHDNYIDFYPDADEYTYEDLCFTEGGAPIKAWLNEGREAQSYRWRPDRFMPFVTRNLQLIKQGVAPTAYFIDVFTSAGCFDYYDHEGNFHPSTETRQKWGEAFAWIRDYLGGNAPTNSEAGHDQLTGYLDGADCQHLTLSDTPKEHTIYLRCDDWERTPWYDAVNHDRFILHGVGYSSRYEGGLDRVDHGINSDDYISCEMLTGHALMVDAGSWGHQAIRKYWLAQNVARNLALKQITNVEYVNDDMHRVIVTWNNGTKVYVNRGDQDWVVEGHDLPRYGYLVTGDGLSSVIETRDGVFCESSSSEGTWYCNARTHDPDRRLRIEPRVENFRYLAGRKFTYDMVWKADEPTARDMRVFVHFYDERAGTRNKIVFQDDHMPSAGTSTWNGEIRYSRTIEVPEDAQGEYVVAFGMYDASGRLSLRGARAQPAGGSAIWVGTLDVSREGDEVTGITLTPPPPPEEPPLGRTNLARKPLDFGFAVTDGAFRIERTDTGLRVTPLPDMQVFSLTLDLEGLGLEGKTVQQVLAVDDAGRSRAADFQQDGATLSFKHDGKSFAYDVRM